MSLPAPAAPGSPPQLRRLEAGLLNALGDTPAVCLTGASRTGKSTLVRSLQAALPAAVCRAFTDPATLAEVKGDPAAFLHALPALAFLEDVDQAPDLLPWLKPALAGGQRLLLTTTRRLPGLAEGLSRSLESFTLWPLAQAEREGTFPGLIDACFEGDPTGLRLPPLLRQDLLDRLLTGGYPEVTDLTPARRETWFHGYLTALLQGRLRHLTELREVRHLIKLLTLPGPETGPARRCRDLLEEVHVLASLAGETTGRSRWFVDSALQAQVLGMAPAALATQPALAAPLMETFAVMELLKTAPWSRSRPTLSLHRAGTQALVVLEDRRHQLVAFTVCGTSTVQAEAFQGLQALRDRVGDRLRTGMVLHAGGEARPGGKGFWSLPLQALWAPRG